MFIFVDGRLTLFVLMACMYGAAFFIGQWAKRGKTWYLRKMPAIDALVEGIGRATELGRPVHFSAGVDRAGPGDPDRAQAYPILKFVAENCAQRDCRLITTVGKADVYAICDQIVKEAAVTSGNPDWYKAEDVQFLGEDQFVYAAGVMGLLPQEKVATNYIFGYHRGSLINLLEAGKMNDCFQIGGMARQSGEMAFLAICCDYWMVLEEMIAAGAYISKDPGQLSTVATQDYVKFALLALMITGALLITANIDFIKRLVLL